MRFTAVVDTSALVELVVNPRPNTALAQRLLSGAAAAPELIDVELLGVVRRLNRKGTLTDDQAEFVLGNVRDMPITRTSHRDLVRRCWEIRHTVSSRDAFFVALAELLDAPLVTCDGKLARSHGHDAAIEVYPVS
ncbi:type II toxin-antitoxin system VapC family toxin [Saccharothrix variisporea]|uniref:Ribonuclease VapC n=1 Tax=Saccharothrix variisporea TaxID=543527 RepID=A0A495X5B2_9PSEU|nr:type II toxin-antitoxin system VapC family toxin [Saccharothrix variisporea]RKT68415.1 putative nucleic acid-binding protein [Saccharothrix variisporea]